ncbi:MAG: glycosyltransferase family A protein [Ilumatobacteraceae bacterium]
MPSPTSSSAVDVTAVMCTRNRSHSIGQAVKTVLANDYPSFDMIVVDQSTDDSTGEVLRPIAAADPRLTYLHVTEAGLSRAYNTGIKATTGETLVFTDDDCVVAADWITTIVDAFAAEPDGDLLYGQVVPFEEGEGFVLTPMITIDQPSRMAKGEGFKVFGMGANFAARRRLFDKVGYFDEVLGGGGPLKSSQDFDLVYRVYQGGAVTLLRPEVIIRHDGRRESQDWPALLRAYGYGDGAFYTKHVRCRDPYALWLFTKQMVRMVGKVGAKTVLRRQPWEQHYVSGVVAGVRGSFGWNVDRRTRLYTTQKNTQRKVAARG